MKFAKSLLVLSMAGVAPCLAHNWLKSPPTRNGNEASGSKPCPSAKDGYVPYTVKGGETIEASWSVNHDQDHWLVIEKTEDLLEDSPNKVAMIHPADKGTINAPAEAGTYVLQYGWTGYRNCLTLIVEAPEVVDVTCAGTGEDTECIELHGPQSSCVSNECTCNTGYTMTDTVCASDVPEAVDCAFFCTDAIENCEGESKIYDDMDDCLAKCATFPIGEINDATGNSLNCRFWHLHVEKDATNHCSHASYSGLDKEHCAEGDYKHGVAVKMTADLSPTSSTNDQLKGFLTTTLKELGVEGASIMVSESADGEFVAIVHASNAAEVKTIVDSGAALQTGLDTASSGVVSKSTTLSYAVASDGSGTGGATDTQAGSDIAAASVVSPAAAIALCLALAQFLCM